MAVRLESVFRSPSSSLKFKTLICVLALFWIWWGGPGGGAVPLLFFLGAAMFFYFSSFFQGARLLISFIVWVALSLIAVNSADGFYAFIFSVALAGPPFYILLAIKEYFLVDRRGWYAVLNLTLAIWAAAAAFLFSAYAPLLGIVYFFLIYESLIFGSSGERAPLFSFSGSLILYETIWAVSLLPIGFVSQAALVSLFYYVIRELILAHLNGRLSRFYILRWATVIVLVSTAVLLGSRWSL